LNPALNSLAFLVGTWRGRGSGYYPTIEKFEYEEEVQFRHVGKPFLAYSQRTWAANETKAPMHTETGYLRPAASSKVEMLVCDPTGVAQLYTGIVSSEHTRRLELETFAVQTTPTAKEVKALRRIITVDTTEEGDVLSYKLDMEAVGQPMQPHLDASLKKQPEPQSTEISIEEFNAKKETDPSDLTILDVREKEEFESKHLHGAINIPLGLLLSITDAADPLLPPLRKGNVLVYCNSGLRASLAANEMKKWGLAQKQNIYALRGSCI